VFTLRHSKVAVIQSVVVVLLYVFWGRSSFIASVDILPYYVLVAGALGCLCAITTTRLITDPANNTLGAKSKPRVKLDKFTKAMFFVGAAMMYGVLLFLSLSNGVSSNLARYCGKPFTSQVVVTKLQNRSGRSFPGCRLVATFGSAHPQLGEALCICSTEQFRRLRVGQRIELSGKRFVLGAEVERIDIIGEEG
jgi:hypothetical protein